MVGNNAFCCHSISVLNWNGSSVNPSYSNRTAPVIEVITDILKKENVQSAIRHFPCFIIKDWWRYRHFHEGAWDRLQLHLAQRETSQHIDHIEVEHAKAQVACTTMLYKVTPIARRQATHVNTYYPDMNNNIWFSKHLQGLHYGIRVTIFFFPFYCFMIFSLFPDHFPVDVYIKTVYKIAIKMCMGTDKNGNA